MTFVETINKFKTYTERKGFPAKPRIGLLSPAFPHEFNVSAGHDYAREIFKTSEPIVVPIRYSLIDTCFRRIDMERVGLSDSHLFLFHIALFACGIRKENMDPHLKDLVHDFIELLTNVMGISKNKLLITVFNGGKVLNFNFNRESSLIEALEESGIDESRILPLDGRRNFFLAQNVECCGPTCEVYVDMADKVSYTSRFIEIGSINFYKYLNRNNSLHISSNQVFACGIGVERTLMALQNKQNIFDIDIISPLLNIVNKYLSSPLEKIIFSNSIRNIVDSTRAATFILSEGIMPDNSSHGRILKKLIKNIVSQMKYLHIFDFELLDELEDMTKKIYADFYPKIKQSRLGLRVIITDRFQRMAEGVHE